VLVLVSVFASMAAATARATLTGTVALAPGATVIPGNATAQPAGTLLATLSAPFTNATGTASGTVASAVFQEAGGTLDFYYQVTENATAPNCGGPTQPVCASLARMTATNFSGVSTSVGFRSDGSTLPISPFVNGTVSPVTADRNVGGDVVGFSFSPPASANIQPGQVSFVLIISTNATNFAPGNASVVDGGVTTVAAFEPVAPPTPTPTTTPTSTPTSPPTSTPTPVPVVPTLNERGMLIFGLLVAGAGLLLLIRRR
jgi:hypothetical protein